MVACNTAPFHVFPSKIVTIRWPKYSDVPVSEWPGPMKISQILNSEPWCTFRVHREWWHGVQHGRKFFREVVYCVSLLSCLKDRTISMASTETRQSWEQQIHNRRVLSNPKPTTVHALCLIIQYCGEFGSHWPRTASAWLFATSFSINKLMPTVFDFGYTMPLPCQREECVRVIRATSNIAVLSLTNTITVVRYTANKNDAEAIEINESPMSQESTTCT